MLWGIDNRLLHSMDGSSLESYGVHKSNSKKAKLYDLLRTTNGERIQKFFGLFFRVLVIIAVTGFNVTAIGLVLYGPEIKSVINTRNEKKIADAQSYLAITKIDLEEAVTKWEDWFIKEAEAKASYEQVGNKARAVEIQEGIERNKKDYAKWKVSGSQAANVTAAEEMLTRVKKEVASTVGINDRFVILEEIAKGNPIISSIGIMFGLVESLVFLLKIGKAPDEYDYRLSERNRAIKIASYNQLHDLHLHEDEETEGSNNGSESPNTASATPQTTEEKPEKVDAEAVSDEERKPMPTSKGKDVEVYARQENLVKSAVDKIRQAGIVP